MRAILTLAFLIVSLKGAVPEVKYQDPLGVESDRSTSSDANINSQAAPGTTYQWALALQPTAADAPHHQSENPINAQQPSALATSKVVADRLPPDSVETLCQALLTSAQRNDLPVTFFANLIWQESGFQHDAVSSAGALGIAQFMPAVAMEVGLGNPLDPHEALPASAKLLHSLREQFGNLGFAAAAYNAGPHRVSDWLEHGRTLPVETQNYVTRVTGARSRSGASRHKMICRSRSCGLCRVAACRHSPNSSRRKKRKGISNRIKTEPQRLRGKPPMPRLRITRHECFGRR